MAAAKEEPRTEKIVCRVTAKQLAAITKRAAEQSRKVPDQIRWELFGGGRA